MMPPLIPSVSWTERYEELRRYVLNGNNIFERKPLSLVLWLTQGMAGWMRGWTKVEKQLPTVALARMPFEPTTLWQHQLTLLLARFTIHRLYPALYL
jgi:hypothetical protein